MLGRGVLPSIWSHCQHSLSPLTATNLFFLTLTQFRFLTGSVVVFFTCKRKNSLKPVSSDAKSLGNLHQGHFGFVKLNSQDLLILKMFF